MLCKALKALEEAKELKPRTPGLARYLAEAYERSGNRRAAEAERARSGAHFVPGELTAAERRSCPVSCQVGGSDCPTRKGASGRQKQGCQSGECPAPLASLLTAAG